MFEQIRNWHAKRQAKKAFRTLSEFYPDKSVTLTVEVERETDGRWIAEVPDLPGVMAYGATIGDAVKKAAVLALRVLADRLEHEEAKPAQAMHFSIVPRECVASR